MILRLRPVIGWLELLLNWTGPLSFYTESGLRYYVRNWFFVPVAVGVEGGALIVSGLRIKCLSLSAWGAFGSDG